MDYKRILVAVRGANDPPPAFLRAMALAGRSRAKLLLVHCMAQKTVAELEDRVGVFSEMEQSQALRKRNHLREHEAEHLRAWLESYCERARKEGIEAEPVVEVGNAGEQVVEIAKHWEADLVVIHRSRRSGFMERLLGSVSDYVIHRAPCSVLLVR